MAILKIWDATGKVQEIAVMKGDKGDPGAQGIQGIQGAKGDKGDKGDPGDPTELFDRLWPVGSIYMSLEATDPADRFGGVWEPIENAFLLGASSAHPAGERGGEETHTLTEAEMPVHTHEQAEMAWGHDWLGGVGQWSASSSAMDSQKYTTKAAGGGQAHNNMPPYLSVFIWKRIS